ATPVLSFFDVCLAEFPPPAGVVDALYESFPLLFLRQVQEEFDDPGPVAMEVALEPHDRFIASLPDVAVLLRGQPLGAEDLGMHPSDQNLLVIGAFEDPDPSPLGEAERGPP